MKKFYFTLFFFAICNYIFSQDLNYFLPTGVTYNPSVPKPREVIHHEVGEWHVTHDRLVNYMQAVAAAAPDRVKLQTMGYSYEGRPQVLLIFSSKKNLDNLEQIRQQHLLLSDPAKSASADVSKMPIVLYIGHSIHGNEPSGSNASLVTAYYLAAAQGKEIEDILDNEIILFDPAFNPDGLQRFSTWANQHKSKNLVTDPADREYNEVWPGGRYNHYWFDLNRDWLPAVHPESQNRLKVFYAWKPNILTDHHEQGSNASFFFQPGVPSRVNPLTPARNQELTAMLGRYHAKNLDAIGSLYFTKENYDDFYYGKGSTFPDINGGIGILFEQASSRGHVQETVNGVLRFPFTIRNQFVTALSTIQGARELRTSFLEFQRDFYSKTNTGNNNGYVFGDDKDHGTTNLFIEMLQRHGIAVQEYTGPYDNEFKKGSSYTVSLKQPQQVLIKAIFDKQFKYEDSLFYDITSWTMPLAFGLPYKEINNITAGSQVPPVQPAGGKVWGGQSAYAYLMKWDEFYAPKALYELQQAGLITKVATNKFQMTTTEGQSSFDYGTILVPVAMQDKSAEEVFQVIQRAASNTGINFYGLKGGNVLSGSDLGSSKFSTLKKPNVAMIVGSGVAALDAGEIWHLMDQRMNIPATHLEQSMFNRTDLSRYNTLIMVSGFYNDLDKDKLKSWVQDGGTLILEEDAVTWAARNGISGVTLKRAKNAGDSGVRLPYVQRVENDGAQEINGSIFGADVDLTHPLAYGYHDKKVSLFKASKVFIDKSKNPYATPFYYGSDPLQSGYISKENLAMIKNSGAVVVNAVGSGRIINIADNPNLRGFWLGGTKLLMNAIFFGRIIDAASARAADEE